MEAVGVVCVDAGIIRSLSPRWLANLAGYGGPLLTWVPLVFARESTAKRKLSLTLLWYLGLVGFVRHSQHFLPHGWDPSGHIFVYGAQLVPLWLVALPSRVPSPLQAAVERVLLAWSCALWYLTVSTAAFFHTLSESITGWLLVLGLFGVHQLRTRVARPPELASVPVMSLTFLAWLASSAGGWYYAMVHSRSVGTRAAELAYDLVLWLWLGWLVRLPDKRLHQQR